MARRGNNVGSALSGVVLIFVVILFLLIRVLVHLAPIALLVCTIIASQHLINAVRQQQSISTKTQAIALATLTASGALGIVLMLLGLNVIPLPEANLLLPAMPVFNLAVGGGLLAVAASGFPRVHVARKAAAAQIAHEEERARLESQAQAQANAERLIQLDQMINEATIEADFADASFGSGAADAFRHDIDAAKAEAATGYVTNLEYWQSKFGQHANEFTGLRMASAEGFTDLAASVREQEIRLTAAKATTAAMQPVADQRSLRTANEKLAAAEDAIAKARSGHEQATRSASAGDNKTATMVAAVAQKHLGSSDELLDSVDDLWHQLATV